MLRGGARWPCFTLHDYTLQPLAQLTGAGAVAELEAAVRERSTGPVELTAAQVRACRGPALDTLPHARHLWCHLIFCA